MWQVMDNDFNLQLLGHLSNWSERLNGVSQFSRSVLVPFACRLIGRGRPQHRFSGSQQ